MYIFAQIGTLDEMHNLVLRLTTIPQRKDVIVLKDDDMTEAMVPMSGVTIRVLRVTTRNLPSSSYALSAKILYEIIAIP